MTDPPAKDEPRGTHFDRESLDRSVRYVLEQTREAIERFGPRAPGSPEEKRIQEFLQGELEVFTGKDVHLEPFPVAQKAFMALPLVSGLLLFLSFPAYWFSSWFALGFSSLSLIVNIQQLLRYKRFLDPLFPKETSYNVIAVQESKRPTKKRYVLNSHPDGAYEWRWNYLCPQVFPYLLLFSLSSLFFKFGSDLLISVSSLGVGNLETAELWVGFAQILFLPGVLVALGYTNFSVVSPGANDNLSGVFISLAIAKFFHERADRLEETEMVYLITGSEEAGLRGAKEYVRHHRQDHEDLETVFVTLDTIRDLEYLYVYNKDMNGRVLHDPGVCALLKTAGKRCGIDLPDGTIHLGSTDAAAFTEGGLRAGAICAMDPHPADFYHTRRDNWDNMNPECIRATLEIVMESIHLFDREGCPRPTGHSR